MSGEEEEEEEEEEEKPKQMQGLRGYWSSSRGESTVGGSLLSLYVTDQEKQLRRTATVTRPVFFITRNLLSNINKICCRKLGAELIVCGSTFSHSKEMISCPW